MSFLYDPRTKRPQVWTIPVFIFITFGIFFAFYAYGQKKAAGRVQEPVTAEVERTF